MGIFELYSIHFVKSDWLVKILMRLSKSSHFKKSSSSSSNQLSALFSPCLVTSQDASCCSRTAESAFNFLLSLSKIQNFETKNIFEQKNEKIILDLDFGFSVHLLNRIQIFNSRKSQFSTSASTSGPIRIEQKLIASLLDNILSSFEELTAKMIAQKSSLNSQLANQISVLVKLLWETGQLFNQSDLTSPEQIRIDHSITEFIGHFRERRHFKAAFVRYFPEFMQMVFGINSRNSN